MSVAAAQLGEMISSMVYSALASKVVAAVGVSPLLEIHVSSAGSMST